MRVLVTRLTLFSIVFFCSALASADTPVLRAHFIDVGYADAVLLEFPPEGREAPGGRSLPADVAAMLIDAGERRHSARLLSYLKANQTQKIDIAVITHPHKNHFGGLRKVSAGIPIGRVFHNGDPNAEKGYAALLNHLKRKQIPVTVLKRGQKLEHLPAAFTAEVLNPPDMAGTPNDNSIALWLRHDKVSFLFLADIGPDRQDALLAAFPDIRWADCVLVPHHGGPLSEAFIEAFQGRLFIISTGPNRWGLPHEDQLKRLNGRIYRTDKNGTIVVESDGATLKVVPWTPKDR